MKIRYLEKILMHREHRYGKTEESVHDHTRIGVHDQAENQGLGAPKTCIKVRKRAVIVKKHVLREMSKLYKIGPDRQMNGLSQIIIGLG